MLEQFKGWRTMLVSVAGLVPFVIDAINLVDLDGDMVALISSAALAAVALLRLVTTTPVFKRKPDVPVLPPSE